MDQEKATIVSWEKKEGDLVKKDETILVVETEKVAIEVTSPADGILSGIKCKPGDVLPVSTIIAYILKPGESLPEENGKPSNEERKPQQIEESKPSNTPTQASPLALRVAQDLGVDISKVPSKGDKISKEDVETYAAQLKQQSIVEPANGKIAATPAARRISEESGIPLNGLQGSGPHGRIQAGDVKSGASQKSSTTDREAELIAYTGLRAKIGNRLQMSMQDAPHIAETVEADISRLEDLKKRLNEISEQKGLGKVSMTAIIVHLVAWALERNPMINSSLIGENIHLWKDINIGIATALDNGLIVPVLHQANKLNFYETAEKVNDLSLRAKNGKLELSEVSRGTFTISNLGMYGIRSFRAVINPPESAILAVGAAVRKPVVIDEHDTVAVRPIISFTLSADHRVIDGVVAAQFLVDLLKVVENPEILLV